MQDFMFHPSLYVCSPKHTITYNIDTKGVFHIIALATRTTTQDTKNAREFALEIISNLNYNKINIKEISKSDLIPEVTNYMCLFKKAVNLVEDIMLSPYTFIGKKRLEKEFTLIIDDDI